MKRSHLIFILLLIILRTLFVCKNIRAENNASILYGDAASYYSIATCIATSHGYNYGTNCDDAGTALWRSPVWPMYLSIPVRISGHSGLKSVLYCNAVIYAVLLFLLVVALVKTRILEFNRWYEWLLLAILLFEPHHLKYSSSFYSESFSAFLVFATSLWLFARKGQVMLDVVFAIVAGLTVLCHPVMAFFVSAIVAFRFFQADIKLLNRLLIGGVFCLVVLSWPVRNYVSQGHMVLTISQGATFSKGWNRHTADSFTNTRGDLAPEELNLLFVQYDTARFKTDFFYRSNVYSTATKAFMHSVPLSTLVHIGFVKLATNFYPFPQTKKSGLVESMCSLYNVLFLISILLFACSKKLRQRFPTEFLLVVFVVLGQSIMSVMIYTGLRFNSPYYLLLSLVFIRMILGFIRDGFRQPSLV